MPPRRAGARYAPAEDTYLLREVVERFSGRSCLEIGFGSGAVLEAASSRFGLVVGTDVLELADAGLARGDGWELVLADRATCFRDRVFDLVVFNPPYLPSVRIEDVAVDGGPTGTEVPFSFLQEALRVARNDGVVLAILSDQGDQGRFLSHCEFLGLEVETVAQQRLFYERLSVMKIRKGGTKATATGAAP